MNSEIKIRIATIDDAQALLDIYSHYVKQTTLTFEYEVPTLTEFQNRISHTLERYPYLVAESDGEIIGYSYAGQFHPRPAYGWSAETTIYLKPDCRRKGVGRKLYTLLEEILKEQGVVKAIALITFPIDEYSDFNSMQFHEKLGYHLAGKIDHNGYKFNRWYSTIWMDKTIGTPKADMIGIKKFDDVKEKFVDKIR